MCSTFLPGLVFVEDCADLFKCFFQHDSTLSRCSSAYSTHIHFGYFDNKTNRLENRHAIGNIVAAQLLCISNFCKQLIKDGTFCVFGHQPELEKAVKVQRFSKKRTRLYQSVKARLQSTASLLNCLTEIELNKKLQSTMKI